QLLQAGDGGEELLRRLVGLRREELEAERGRVPAEDVLNVHGQGSFSLVPKLCLGTPAAKLGLAGFQARSGASRLTFPNRAWERKVYFTYSSGNSTGTAGSLPGRLTVSRTPAAGSGAGSRPARSSRGACASRSIWYTADRPAA